MNKDDDNDDDEEEGGWFKSAARTPPEEMFMLLLLLLLVLLSSWLLRCWVSFSSFSPPCFIVSFPARLSGPGAILSSWLLGSVGRNTSSDDRFSPGPFRTEILMPCLAKHCDNAVDPGYYGFLSE